MPRITRKYEIDLSAPPSRRWKRMIRAERARARALISNCVREAELLARRSVLSSAALTAARSLLPLIYGVYGASDDYEFAQDLDAWAAGTGIHRDDLIFANLLYETSQVAACTAVAFDLPGKAGVAHVRNMDWPLSAAGPFSCLIQYEGACGPFTTVGWPGYIGVLSGIAPGRFSGTINQAPMARRMAVTGWPKPTADWPASFALRWVFENCETYEDAVQDLAENTELAASAFYLLAGTEPGEAAVIEHSGPEASIRRLRGGVIAVANHYEGEAYRAHNSHWDDFSVTDSRARRKCAAQGAKAIRRTPTMARLLKILSVEPAFWDLTAQQMAFVPKTGKYAALYHDTDEAVMEHLTDEEDE